MAEETSAPPERRRRRRARRVSLAVWAGIGTFAALLLLDGLWAGTALLRNLTTARSELSVAIESVVTGDAGAAVPHLAAAAEASDRARRAVAHPSLGIAGLLPLAGENIAAAAAVAEASHATAEAGGALVRTARSLGWSDIGLPAADAAGSLDVASYRAAVPEMDAVVRRLSAALSELEDAGGDGLVGPVAAGYRDAVEGLRRRADLARRFRDTLRLVPAMFGGQGPRRYLVVVPSLGVPRAGGGAPTSVGILTALDGQLSIDELVPASSAIAGAPTAPDWPTTARTLIEAASASGTPRVRGAILIDAVALEDLVWVSGDVTVDDREVPLSDSTTTTALEIDAFLGISPGRTARTHAAWASAVLAGFLEQRPGVESFALAAAGAARDRHLAIYLVGRTQQRLVRALGLDGAARIGRSDRLPVLATWTAIGSAHVGAFVDTSIREDIRIREGGAAAVRVEVLFENRAGTDVPSVLLGRPASGLPAGTFVADVTLFLPRGARAVVAETSRPSPIVAGRRLGLDTVTGSVTVRGGESATLTVTYVVDDAVTERDGNQGVSLRLVPQPTLDGVRFVVRVVGPDGATVGSASRGFERRGQTAVFSGVRSGPVDLDVRYVS